jgi:hypothetical protein
MHSLTASGASLCISDKPFNGRSWYWLPVSWYGRTSGLTKQSPTLPAQTLMLNCCWCLDWVLHGDCSLPTGGGCENLWCLCQNLLHLKRALTKEREAQHIVKQTADTKFLMLDSQQAWDPGLAINGMDTATAYAVLPRRSFAQHLTLSLFISFWHPHSLQLSPGHTFQCQVSGHISLFPSWH